MPAIGLKHHSNTMKTVEISAFGAPDVLRLAERPDAVLGA
jgi:hypothetical protein